MTQPTVDEVYMRTAWPNHGCQDICHMDGSSILSVVNSDGPLLTVEQLKFLDHIVACVNVCEGLRPELIQQLIRDAGKALAFAQDCVVVGTPFDKLQSTLRRLTKAVAEVPT